MYIFASFDYWRLCAIWHVKISNTGRVYCI